ncbi:MAG TPA: prepilin-type N-terminal cleavage/methylation domain-containing protein [Fimbriimonadaceae bacterium]|jgi:prepilin-type N-terminal cleavage/methylation domain-containing protein/prepilin-type processing-associated H-X9-DG protein
MNKRTRVFCAFTLIEVMVVIAIIGTLAGLLFPVFSSAKEAARGTSCLSNVKQLTVAEMLYQNDYDDNICPEVLFQNLAQFPWNGWFGQLPSATDPLDSTKALLAPYLHNTSIFNCPDIDVITDPVSEDLSYAINDHLCVTTINLQTFKPTFTVVNMSEVQLPAETIIFGDGAENVSGPEVTKRAILQFNTQFANGTSRGFLHARHGGQLAMVAWLDGHAKPEHLSYNTRNDNAEYTATWEQQNGLGDFLKYPRQYVGATGTEPSVQDMYYYLPDKSVDNTAGHTTLTDWLLL